MKLTTKTRYATRAMVDLASQSKGEPITLATIARRQNVTVKYLGKIFRQLLRSNLVESKKGPGGGYYLSRHPKLIRLSEIMEAVGESRAPVYCVARRRRKECGNKNRCPTRSHWRKLYKLIDEFCNQLTLYGIAKEQDLKAIE
jgi:Rrf2 family iron-sulfur cluster assembly transcriptional regulator